MSETTPFRWRRAFLAALADTANLTSSAKAAGVDRSTIYAHQKKSPLFKADLARALATGRAKTANGTLPPALRAAARPMAVRASKSGGTCVMETGEGRWNADLEELFLAELARTANVSKAAKAINMSDVALYRRRKTWPGFAAAWDEAKAMAVDRLDLMLIEAGTNLFDPPKTAEPHGPPTMTVAEALRVVERHNPVHKSGRAKRLGWRAAPPDPAELRAEILRRLDLIERHEGRMQDG
jgi:hypothetical protein